jgi:hypothetical protein
MNRLRYLFAGILLLLALPFWRFADLIAVASPFGFFLTVALAFWFAVFIAIPVKLIFPKIKTYALILGILGFGALAWWSTPLSKMATKDPDFNHCGCITFTGVFYPARKILTDAYYDDLEARNQMCWVRKMISRVPERFDDQQEVDNYTKLIQEKLFKPEIKYRASLPLIAFLYLRINISSGNFVGAKNIYDSLHFWIDHYTEEISSRQYSVWNWPHSNYIQFEYGLIEKNWQDLIDNIVLE